MKIVILTPIQPEYHAAKSLILNKSIEINRSSMTVYEVGDFEQHKIAVRQTGSGNDIIAAAAKDAIEFFNPELILLVGTAGGVKSKVNIGDIIIGSRAYGYEGGREMDDNFLTRPKVHHASPALVELARIVAQNKNWIKRTSHKNDKYSVFEGAIASGEKVIESRKGVIYERLKKNYNDTIALEMEAYGFFEALYRHEKVLKLNIRSISDELSDKEAANKKGSKELASENASAFAFELIAKLNLLTEKIDINEQKINDTNIPTKKDLKKLVLEGEFKEVLTLMKKHGLEQDKVILLLKQVLMLEEEEALRMVNREDARIEKLQHSKSILFFINKIKE